MDFINKAMGNTGGNSANQGSQPQQTQQGSSSSGGGFMNKINNMAGGGQQGEKNEDALDKGIDFVQERFLGQGDQSNESAAEQMKDEQIAGFIRGQYKNATGSEFPIKDKERKYGM
ncbi:hypothetical protein jhhlp_004001 [Lomentospora prolificans]|uniref:DNA damage-responsive protein 48 n=1 Tax=Lomentospora prolificans TaxID=41688 RepID=A0A2N3NAC2_9PEZI|nr:hypothetical protein jhhlp_004001 [Lomentospora prolificans]